MIWHFFPAKSAQWRRFAGGCIFFLPGKSSPFENLSPHPDNLAGRLEGLYKLVEETGADSGGDAGGVDAAGDCEKCFEAILSLSCRRPRSAPRAVA